ncbi:MAG TPA: hypothetical protein VLJ86_12765 [Ramlibacter sp.]|nr:hypothetical protein [Ramlibacter sp.]
MLNKVGFVPAATQIARGLVKSIGQVQSSTRAATVSHSCAPSFSSVSKESEGLARADRRRAAIVANADGQASCEAGAPRLWPASGRWIVNDDGVAAGPGDWLRERARVNAGPQPDAVSAQQADAKALATQGPAKQTLQKTVANTMLAGLVRPLNEAVAHRGSGVAAGLDLLDLQGGEAIAEVDPDHLQMGVRLARYGCSYDASVSNMEFHSAYRAELEHFRAGQPSGERAGIFSREHWSPEQLSCMAQDVALRLCINPGTELLPAPPTGGFKAILSLSNFQHMTLADIESVLMMGAQCLQARGGFIFEFEHRADIRKSAVAGVNGRGHTTVSFSDLARTTQDAGLELVCLHMRFRSLAEPGRTLIPTRVVRPDKGQAISVERADAAAITGFAEIGANKALLRHPVVIEASGMFVKKG